MVYASITILISLVPVVLGSSNNPSLQRRLQDGLAHTPQMGWNTYNQYGCSPNETIVKTNAQALVDLGLADLGYRYVTTDCGWTVADRLPNGTLTWNETLFPSGFPALGRYLHDRGLLFGVYQDSGIKLCGSPPDQAGSLYHEDVDAKTFEEWEVDSLKYDNCYSDAATSYPNVNYAPSLSPAPRFANMSHYLQGLARPILFQVCEWGIDFPALWAPPIGHSWRIGNDIIPHWRSIFRTVNQAAPQTGFAGKGQWPDLDMLIVGLDVLSTAEEETHFSLWSVLKSPLVIGADLSRLSADSLNVLTKKDVIGFNQDGEGVSASLRRRWSDDGVDVWAGPLEGGKMVVAVVNWDGEQEERDITLDLPDVGVQYAGVVRNIWRGEQSNGDGVKTSYTAAVKAHGTMLLELGGEIVEAGTYPADLFAVSNGDTTTFNSIYAQTSSNNYLLTISFTDSNSNPSSNTLTITSPTTNYKTTITRPRSSKTVSLRIPLLAGSTNQITIRQPQHSSHHSTISSIKITGPESTYYPATGANFTLTGTAAPETCGAGFCLPVSSKIGHIGVSGTAAASIPATTVSSSSSVVGVDGGQKYLEIDYINNEVAFDSSWGWGSNSRNLTISVNGGDPVRLEVPLSGRHSELFGPGKGWWDTATLGVLTGGWKDGVNEVVFGNVGGSDGFQSWGPDLVGVRVYD